jgi:hypothetical protein
MNYTNRYDALEECERLKKMQDREIDARPVGCPCDFFPGCYLCAGNGVYFELFYLLCSHAVQDDDRDELECVESDCAERERLKNVTQNTESNPFAGIEAPFLGIQEVVEDEMEEVLR